MTENELSNALISAGDEGKGDLINQCMHGFGGAGAKCMHGFTGKETLTRDSTEAILVHLVQKIDLPNLYLVSVIHPKRRV